METLTGAGFLNVAFDGMPAAIARTDTPSGIAVVIGNSCVKSATSILALRFFLFASAIPVASTHLPVSRSPNASARAAVAPGQSAGLATSPSLHPFSKR